MNERISPGKREEENLHPLLGKLYLLLMVSGKDDARPVSDEIDRRLKILDKIDDLAKEGIQSVDGHYYLQKIKELSNI